MFKGGRWRSEKKWVKVAFKLQFHATQLSQVDGDTIIISLIPSDIGKPTQKLEKAIVRDGGCCWDNPIQETVKFFHDPKTGKINKKIYNFVVSTGPSKASLIGEASIDFASYAESTKTTSVSLPLKNTKSDAIMHVSIQRLNENMDQREAEKTEKANENYKDRSLKNQLSISDADGTVTSNSAEDEPVNKPNLNIVELNTNRRASSVSDLTLSSSGSSSELIIPRDFGSRSQLSILHKTTSDVSGTFQGDQIRSPWNWLRGSAPEFSTDDSIGGDCEDASGIIIEKLKAELSAVSRQASLSDLELQTLRKQIIKESKRGQELLKEVVILKEERDLYKEESENLKVFRKHADNVKSKDKSKLEGGEWDPLALLEELRQEVYYEKDLNANLRIQLQKTQESNSELILAVRDLDELLEQKNKEIPRISSKNELGSESEDDEEQKELDELVKVHTDVKDTHILERKVRDLCNELEICRRDRDELEAHMEQISLDYEILKQENHDLGYRLEQSELQEQLKMQYECSPPYTVINELETHAINLENKLKEQTDELSNSLDKISKLENHIKSLEEETEKKALELKADLESITNARVEQEQRAIKAEENLRKLRWQNGKTAERLQGEFCKLSVQMSSTFEENERLAMKYLSQADELRSQKMYLQELLEKSKQEVASIKEQYEEKLHELEKENRKLFEGVKSRERLERELEFTKKSMEESEILLERGEKERNSMENVIALLKKELDNSMKELKILRSLKDEKESIITKLESELESLKEDEFEKEKLRKQIIQLKSELKKKEETFSSLEKKLKEGTKISPRNSNKSVAALCNKKEVANMKDKIKLLEGQIKMKEAALENSTNSFSEKEKDLHHKIEELEKRLEELDHNTANFCEYDKLEVVKGSEEILPNGNMCNKNRTNAAVIESKNEITTDKETEASKVNASNDRNFDELCNEMQLLKERNNTMEAELKEMQERYSEISLKFAEVEGERQQLVMMVRNLKNVKKS